MNLYEFRMALTRVGYYKIGGGYFSTVYAHRRTPSRVIKTGYAAPKWEAYVRWAAENGFAGGFAPRVYHFKVLEDGYAASMERLEEFSELSPGQFNQYKQLKWALGRTHDEAIPSTELFCFAKMYLHHFTMADDYGRRNVMFRNNGIVLTDPMADWNNVIGFSRGWRYAGQVKYRRT